MSRARPVVVAMGDSITLGVGDGTQRADGSVGWASHVARALGAVTFVNLAANGARARDVARDQVPRALEADPDIVLVTAGGNDVLRSDFDPAEVRRELTSSLAALARPDRSLVVISIDRIGLFEALPAPVATAMARRVASVNRAVIAAASAAGATVLDGAAVFRETGSRAWHVDRIHPSPLGHRSLAATAVAALARTWTVVGTIPPPPRPPGLHLKVLWLAVCGVPWALKRSRDLLPQIVRVVAHELLDDRRAQSL